MTVDRSIFRPLSLLAARAMRSVLALALVSASCFAAAQSFPARPVRLVVPYPAGGPLDEVARIFGQRLTEMWGQALVVENRGGAGGSLGAEVVARSAPDGYTLLIGNAGPITVNPGLRRDLPYDPQRDLAPVTQIVAAPMVLVVHPSLPVKSVPDLVRLARANPGGLNYASAGIGNLQHLAMESLQALAGIRMNHVPYKGAAPAFVDLVSGRVEVMFANIVGVLPHIWSGKLRPIAVSSARGSPALPRVPSVAATFPQFDFDGWMGIFARAGTPSEVIARLHRDFARVCENGEIREYLAKRGAQAVAGGPQALARIVREETALYAEIIRAAGITAQ
ncbi:MAG TPA: tripartite tricarboxylate transporter substrate binding protein [Burkholderiales bacterium]|nr:tripartite tricarboxylate transporter substrate binding protein [Burkholderiales bacterium]